MFGLRLHSPSDTSLCPPQLEEGALQLDKLPCSIAKFARRVAKRCETLGTKQKATVANFVTEKDPTFMDAGRLAEALAAIVNDALKVRLP